MSTIRYQYVPVPRRRHPVTIAYTAVENVEESKIEISLGASFCHDRDQFNRPLGRTIAEGRLRVVPIKVSVSFDQSKSNAYGRAIAEGLRQLFEFKSREISTFYTPR